MDHTRQESVQMPSGPDIIERSVVVTVLGYLFSAVFLVACSWSATLPFGTAVLTDVEVVTSQEVEIDGPVGVTDTFDEEEAICFFVRGKVPQEISDVMHKESAETRLGMESIWLYENREIEDIPFSLVDLGDLWYGGGMCVEGVAKPFGPGKYEIVINHRENTVGSSTFWIE